MTDTFLKTPNFQMRHRRFLFHRRCIEVCKRGMDVVYFRAKCAARPPRGIPLRPCGIPQWLIGISSRRICSTPQYPSPCRAGRSFPLPLPARRFLCAKFRSEIASLGKIAAYQADWSIMFHSQCGLKLEPIRSSSFSFRLAFEAVSICSLVDVS